MGGSPLVPEVRVPGIIKLLASPMGALVVRLPDRPGRVRSILRQSGMAPVSTAAASRASSSIGALPWGERPTR
jgi:hypothetical protein